jgi:multiple sugar transport system ATP-binding protein
MPALFLEKLCKQFPDGTMAVNSLDLRIDEQTFVTLLGPSGCGKTTTLRMIAGLETPTSGSISLGDRLLNDVPPVRRDIAMVFQSYALYPHLTVRGNLEYPLRKRRVPVSERAARVDRIADQLELRPLLERKPRQLSGGQQQRVALGRAMIRDPELFLLDEPLSNLDAKLRSHMRAELIELHRRVGRTMIYVTHDQLEAMTMSDRIAVLRDGNLQQYAEPEEIYRRPANLFVATFIGTPPMNLIDGEIVTSPEGSVLRASGFELRLPARLASAASTEKATRVTVGVRPEDVVVGSGPWSGHVRIIEPTGHETLVFVDVAGQQLVARVGSDHPVRALTSVPVDIRADRLHLFETQTGMRIG